MCKNPREETGAAHRSTVTFTAAVEARSLPDILTWPWLPVAHCREPLSSSQGLGACEKADSRASETAQQINVPADEPDGLSSNPAWGSHGREKELISASCLLTSANVSPH